MDALEEATARVSAATEQLGAALRQVAPAVAAYRDALLEQGFSRAEATDLCRDMQMSLIGR